jgi:hypothetical protein
MLSSLEHLGENLRSAGYIADSVATTTIYLAAKLHKPLLLEGPAGSGKTQLAYAVAEAANTTIERLQCYEGINEEKAIGKFDEPLQRLCVELIAKSGSVDWECLQTELHTHKFFSAGPLLRALQCNTPCVLLIDELDKVDHAFEAQAFKRAATCFGLGRYLYHFTGTWVDLDERKRPKSVPRLFGWATPQGWRQGLRPGQEADQQPSPSEARGEGSRPPNNKEAPDGSNGEMGSLIGQIVAMAPRLRHRLYRGVLKSVAKAWNPRDIKDAGVLRAVLAQMQAAEQELRRLHKSLSRVAPGPLTSVLRSFGLKSLDQIDNLDNLKRIAHAIGKIADAAQ